MASVLKHVAENKKQLAVYFVFIFDKKINCKNNSTLMVLALIYRKNILTTDK